MGVEDLFREGLLKRIRPSAERADKSLETADNYLQKAKKVFDQRMDDVAILLSYSAVFHASRAILFKEGVAERSHYAIVEYLREKHPEIGKDFIETFDAYRKLRHAVAYGLDTKINAKDSLAAINFAESMLKRIKELFKE